MNKDLDYTMKFEGISDDKMSVSQALDFVNEALLEKVIQYYLNRKKVKTYEKETCISTVCSDGTYSFYS